MFRILSFITAILLAPCLASAAYGPTARYSHYGAAVLSGTTLDATRTFSVSQDDPTQNGMFNYMTLWVTVTDANDSITAFNIACTGSHDGGTSDYTLQGCATLINGVCESVAASHSKGDIETLTASDTKMFPWRYDIGGLPEIECTITNTGGTAADTLAIVITFWN